MILKDFNKKRLMMFGMREDMEIAAEVYESAYKAIESHSKDYIESRKDIQKSMRTAIKNDFIQGYLDGLKAKFEDQVAKYQLVIAVNALVLKEKDDMGFDKAKAATRSSAHDAHATTSGYIQGRSFASGELLK